MGAVPVQDAKWALERNRADVTDVAEDAGGADRPDAIEISQRGAGRRNRFGEPLIAVFELPVQPDDVGEQFGRELAAGPAGDVTGPDCREQRLGLRCGQEPRRAGWDELEQ
jgi:hypothetical protein